MKLLFICRHNMFRSKVAEAYFKKKYKGSFIIVESSGIFPGATLNKPQVKVAKEFGIEIKGTPRKTSIPLLKEQDLVIVAANDIPKKIFDYPWLKGKVKIWKIPDVKTGKDLKGNARTIKAVIRKVDLLIKELENKK